MLTGSCSFKVQTILTNILTPRSQLRAHWGAGTSHAAQEHHTIFHHSPVTHSPLHRAAGDLVGVRGGNRGLSSGYFLHHVRDKRPWIQIPTAGPVSPSLLKLHLPVCKVRTEPCFSTVPQMEGCLKARGSLGVGPSGLGDRTSNLLTFPVWGFNRSINVYLLDVTCVLLPETLSGFLYPLHAFEKVKESIPLGQ